MCGLLALIMGAVTGSRAQTIIPDSALIPSNTYYTDILGSSSIMGRNDDGSSAQLPLGFTLNFFGSDYSTFWVNNNGNVSFTQSISQYTPTGPQGASVPLIAPFFADVDTRNSGSGLVYLRNDIPNEVIVTWDAVGYFGSHADKLDSFQLVLRGPGYSIPVGEGSIGFFYKSMQWETGDASGGSGGFGGTPAAVGFGNGAGQGEVLQGSIQNGISGIVSDHHIWFNQNLTPVPPPPSNPNVPEPGTLSLLAGMGLSGAGMLWRRRRLA